MLMSRVMSSCNANILRTEQLLEKYMYVSCQLSTRNATLLFGTKDVGSSSKSVVGPGDGPFLKYLWAVPYKYVSNFCVNSIMSKY